VAAILCFDFDDTITLENTARQVFERFAKPEWRDFEAEYHAGSLTVEQFNAKAFATVEASREELREFALEVTQPRAGFLELLDWAQWNDWLTAVVSNGFDFYVDALLDKLGAQRIARHAARTRFDYNWRCIYLSPRGIEIEDGFKLSYASAFLGAGDFVAYIGDGESDITAARLAPAAFARDTLWEHLKDEHPRIYPFETFEDVRSVLEREGPTWLAESESGEGPSPQSL
jgi:2-hydroxy-3-keto-5-methylthiopentenyl-1-phosphate phosphatase